MADVQSEIGDTLRLIVEGWLRAGCAIHPGVLTGSTLENVDKLLRAKLLTEQLNGYILPGVELRFLMLDYLRAAYAFDDESENESAFDAQVVSASISAFRKLRDVIEKGVAEAARLAETAVRQ